MTSDDLRQIAANLEPLLKAVLPENVGFVLVLTEFGTEAVERIACCSTDARFEDAAVVLRKVAERIEDEGSINAPGGAA